MCNRNDPSDYVQDPREADPIMRVQNDLDETKIVLVSDLGCGWDCRVGAVDDWPNCIVVCIHAHSCSGSAHLTVTVE